MANKTDKTDKPCTITYQCPYSEYSIEIDCKVFTTAKEEFIQRIITEQCEKKMNSFVSNNDNIRGDDIENIDNNTNIYY